MTRCPSPDGARRPAPEKVKSRCLERFEGRALTRASARPKESGIVRGTDTADSDRRCLFLAPCSPSPAAALASADPPPCTSWPIPWSRPRDLLRHRLGRLARVLYGQAQDLLFGIVQGGVHEDLRRESAARSSAGVDGVAIGGTLGKEKEEMRGVLGFTAPLLPPEAPRHLLGIGEVDDLLAGIALGIDLFDCAVPTRLARHGVALAPEPEGRFRLDLAKARYADDDPRRGLPLRGLPAPQPRLPPLPREARS